MKKILSIVIMAVFCLTDGAHAQGKSEKGQGFKKGVGKVWQGTKKGAKAVGNATAEVASKGKASVTDKKSKQWVGPEGQTVYVDDANKHYWINGKGKRIYVTEAALKARQK